MYYLIGISLLFTFLFAINFVSSLVSTALWRTLAGVTRSWRPRSRSAFIFVLRVLPVIAGLVFILAFVLPAFLLYEPHESGETIGSKQIAVVAVCILGFAVAVFRVFASWWRTRRLVAEWVERSERIDIDGIDAPAFLLQHEFPVFAVVGVFHPRLFIGEQVLAELDETEIAAVVKHELGHLDASDNLRRLAMQLCGDLLVVPMGRGLDRVWTEASEIAADEFAVRTGGSAAALSLASALIKIARLIPHGKMTAAVPLGAFAVQRDEKLLSTRIRRLVDISDAGPVDPGPASRRRVNIAVSLAAALAVIAPLALDSYFLADVHIVSETLLALLR